MEHKTRNMEQPEKFGHHAYAVFGEVGASEELLGMFRDDWKIFTRGNPDFHYYKFNSCGVEEARDIKELQEKKSVVLDGKKIFVIEAETITPPAQSALLKMFEEPTADTHFFLVGNCVRNLLPTLLSRLSKIKIGGVSSSSQARDEAEKFLASGKAERLAFAKNFADEIKDEKRPKADALRFVEQIEAELYRKSKEDGTMPGKVLEGVEKCRDYMTDRSASAKMLLEFVAVLLPQVK